MELDPSNSLFRQRLGRLLYDMGRYRDAEHHLKSALEYSNRTRPKKASDSLGLLAAELGKTREGPDGRAG